MKYMGITNFAIATMISGCLAGCSPHAAFKLRDFDSVAKDFEVGETNEEYIEYLSTIDESFLADWTCPDDEVSGLAAKIASRLVEYLTDCTQPIVTGEGRYFEPEALKRRFGEESGRNEGRPYRRALALGGGGTKAASYSVGVLSGLLDPYRESKASQRMSLDAISSVSGGSYAALWYFSRLIDEYQISSEHRKERSVSVRGMFRDCLPRRYASLESELIDQDTATVLCEVGNNSAYPGIRTPDEAERRETTVRAVKDEVYSGAPVEADAFRFQNHIRGYQDFISGEFDYEVFSDGSEKRKRYVGATRLVGFTLASLPAYSLANLLFDWQDLTLSPSAREYFEGIDRTYGLRPYHCYPRPDSRPRRADGLDSDCLGSRGRPSPNASTARGHTMSALANLYYWHIKERGIGDKEPLIPFWILNTTAEVGVWPLSYSTRANLEDTVFEFTPYSFGSRHFGRWIGTPSALELSKAVGASGAFFDAQQRELNPFLNWIVATSLNALNMNWGVDIDNPRYKSSVRTFHKALPFPLYLMHRNGASRNSAWIHLSDGGQSENTGAWSAIRRGASTIILADNGQDVDGTMVDVCRLKRKLSSRGVFLHMPELGGFSDVCEGAGSKGYPIKKWPRRVVRGCVTTMEGDPGCAGREEAEYFADLFLLKPALNLEVLSKYACDPSQLEKDRQGRCAAMLRRLRTEESGYEEFPTELYGFLVASGALNLSGDGSDFPQNSTVSMTFNSGPYLFAAYRELGRWQARKISEDYLASSRDETLVPKFGPKDLPKPCVRLPVKLPRRQSKC